MNKKNNKFKETVTYVPNINLTNCCRTHEICFDNKMYITLSTSIKIAILKNIYKNIFKYPDITITYIILNIRIKYYMDINLVMFFHNLPKTSVI